MHIHIYIYAYTNKHLNECVPVDGQPNNCNYTNTDCIDIGKQTNIHIHTHTQTKF